MNATLNTDITSVDNPVFLEAAEIYYEFVNNLSNDDDKNFLEAVNRHIVQFQKRDDIKNDLFFVFLNTALFLTETLTNEYKAAYLGIIKLIPFIYCDHHDSKKQFNFSTTEDNKPLITLDLFCGNMKIHYDFTNPDECAHCFYKKSKETDEFKGVMKGTCQLGSSLIYITSLRRNLNMFKEMLA